MNDDELILYFYGDGLSRAERRNVERALAADPALAARYHALAAELGPMVGPQTAPPSADMVRRWHDSIDRAAGQRAATGTRSGGHSWSFLPGAAITAALAIGIGLGVFLSGGPPATPPPALPLADGGTNADEASPVFDRGLRLYLRESERGLAALTAETNGERAVLIMGLIEQNRLYARAARQNDADDLARVLRAFELVLVELAAEDIPPAEAEALRAKLRFEINVMLTKLSLGSSDEPQSI